MYVLDGHTPVPEPDIQKWGRFMGEKDARRVAKATIGPLWISTVFLGLDHGWGNGPPILFETMIFGFSDHDEYQTRCATWDEAVRMHSLAVDIAQTMADVANVALAVFEDKLKVRLKITSGQAGEPSTC
jgi:hypothetical protein